MAQEPPHKPRSDSPTPEEMQAAIEASGYLLEGRIARLMAERGFFVERNCFRPNLTDSGKPIEVDVIGRYFEWVNEANNDTVTASVLVECKNNAQPFAFFTQVQQVTEINDDRIHYGGFPSFSTDPDTKIQVPLHKLLEMKDWHHYCQIREVATQFCSFTRANEKKKWKAEPMKNYSDSFSALAMATAFDSSDGYDVRLQNIQVQVSCPIVVLQGPIYRVQDDGGKAKVLAADHLQLHHATSINGQVISVQIDVVTEAAFPNVMETVLQELRILRVKIKGLYQRLLNSAQIQKRVASQNAVRHMFGHFVKS